LLDDGAVSVSVCEDEPHPAETSIVATTIVTAVEETKPERVSLATVRARLERATDESAVRRNSQLSKACAAELGL
jgi:hypothetical protein